MIPVNSGEFFGTRQLGPSTRVVETDLKPVSESLKQADYSAESTGEIAFENRSIFGEVMDKRL